MDNFLLQAIVTELKSVLVDQRLGKIFQIGATDLLIDFHLRDDRWLAVSTDPQRIALYLTKRSQKQVDEAARSDTGFVSLVKKHLTHGRLIAIDKLGYDRIVQFEFVVEIESEQPRTLKLVFMLIGLAANVLLVDGERIITSLRERDEADVIYLDPAPPAGKLDPSLCPPEKFIELVKATNDDVAEAAQKDLIGFSKIYARELAFRAMRTTIPEAFRSLMRSLFESTPSPTIYSSSSIAESRREIGRENNLTLSFIELEHLTDQEKTSYSSVNDAADTYFTILGELRRFLWHKKQLGSYLASGIKKRRTLIANLQRERQGFANAETHQRYGALLLANLQTAVKNESGFIVTNFYDEAQSAVEIPSANKATAQEAADHYFKSARKARHGLEKIDARLPEIERQLEDLEAQRTRLDSINSAEKLNSLAEQLGLRLTQSQREKEPSGKKQGEKLTGVRRYRSSDGYEILVGRTDRDNDNLTFRIAKSFDLWFHAADYPGSHVVLRNPSRKQVPPRAITEAAQLAAKFSQAGGGAKIAINYCERKYVTKMKGFAPGQVRLSSFKTVLVEPNEAGERIL